MNESKLRNGFFSLVFLWLAGASATALGKTLYVEEFGANDGVCAKAAPCLTIQHALDNAPAGSRIIVGVGVFPGSLTITQDGIKLVSTAGAHGTTIEAAASDGIVIDGDKVSIGQKRKGFTITGNFNNQNGIQVNGSRVKVESNIITPTTGGTDDAIELNGSRATIRYNEVRTFSYGIYQGTAATEPERHLVSGNLFDDITSSDAIQATMNPGAKSRFDGNVITNVSGQSGIYLTSAATTAKSGNKITNNVIMNTAEDAIEVDYGNPLIQNNTIVGVDSTHAGVRLYDTVGAVVRKNLIRDAPVGLLHEQDFTGPIDTTFSQNVVDDVSNHVIALESAFGTFKQVQQNNFTNFACPFRFDSALPPPETIETRKNFWGDPSDVGDGGIPDLACNTNASNALGTGLQMTPTLKPNAVKYKSPI